MFRTGRRIAQLILLVSVIAVLGCPAGPVLSIFPIAFDFGTAVNTDSFVIINAGEGTLTWSVGSTPSWLTVSPLSGTTSPTENTRVDLTVDRSGLPQGITNGEFTVTSNGGAQTIAISVMVPLPPPAPVLQVSPTSLDFGATNTIDTFVVSNVGSDLLTWAATEDIPWLSVSPPSGSTLVKSDTVTVTVNRVGLAIGSYQGDIQIASDGGDATVTVDMTVAGPTPQLEVTPVELDFGSQLTVLTLTVANAGTGSLDWEITHTIPWVTDVSPSSGNIPAKADTVTVTIDRTGQPLGEQTGTLTVTAIGVGTQDVTVRMSVATPELSLSPSVLNFGSFFTNKLFTIGNAGGGSLSWSIDTSGFPAWLSVSPTSGAVSTTPQGVLVTVDRTGLSPGDLTFDIPVSSDAGNGTVTVNATVAVVPVLTVDTGFTNPDGEPLVPLGDEGITFDFTIRNTGTGSLDWAIDPAQFPVWLFIAPVAGSLTTGTDTVTVTISREGLLAGGFSQRVRITSNGGNVTIEVTMQVPLRPSIGVDPAELDFGLDADTGAFFVANFGDPGTVLNFLVESDKPWLFHSPSTGISVGVSGPFKDFKRVNVSIDRGGLESTGATGTFTVRALDFTGAIIPDIPPGTVLISVESSPLSFEAALARLRIPSLVRHIFIMRDFRDNAIGVTPDQIPVESFRIVEDGTLLELAETNQFLTSGANLRTNIALVLDMSGSLFDAVQGLGLPGPDPLQSLYEQVAGDFIDALPATWGIALMEFHDRSQPTRLVQDFTDDRAVLHAALEGLTVEDHGASEFLPAMDDAIARLVDADFPLIAFDTADVRAVVNITDGRLTTPPGEIQDTVDIAVPNHVRFLSVGWGAEVNNEPLARLASLTGGHYYPTHTDDDGLPVIGELEGELNTLANDLMSQLVLSYTTLNEEENVPTRVNAGFNNPIDDPDQGLIQGSFEQILDFDSIIGDVRLGQISMRTSGVAGGTARVIIRGEYIPRNVNKFEFTIASSEAFTVSKVLAADGGLVEDWTLADLGGGVYSLTAPTPEAVLPYGAFGDMLMLTFASVTVTPFTVTLSVDNDLYAGDVTPKFFVFPDSMPVDTDGFLAPAFPTPLVEPLLLAFGDSIDSIPVNIQNIGGSYPEAPAESIVLLNWQVEEQPGYVSIDPDEGSLNSTLVTDVANVELDRTLPPGDRTGFIILSYNAGYVNVGGTIPLIVTATILPPVLTVNANDFNFGDTDTTRTLEITNTGQSTLNWSIDTTGFPGWLSVSRTTGGTTDEIENITITVNRSGLSVGTHISSFFVSSDGGTELITVTVTVT